MQARCVRTEAHGRDKCRRRYSLLMCLVTHSKILYLLFRDTCVYICAHITTIKKEATNLKNKIIGGTWDLERGKGWSK